MQRLYTTLIALIMLCGSIYAQAVAQGTPPTTHKVKKQETVFGIAKAYGLTIEELQAANPEMRSSDFVLKKGIKLSIPAPKPQPTVKPVAVDPLTQHITIGIMLPLHNINGDGKRMLEYYRGILLAVNDLKREGYNLDIHAWNVIEGEDIRPTLLKEEAAKCNIIFGPLYTPQVPALSDFCKRHDIKLVIPFSISAADVQTCDHVYQVYQSEYNITEQTINQYIGAFADCNTVVIDCNDQASKKGPFTFGLRQKLEQLSRTCFVTNINSSMEQFQKAFTSDRKNVVILNTGRSQELGQVIQKLELLQQMRPELKLSLFGYNEWLLYMKPYEKKFRQFDTYIPSYYNYNEQSPAIQRLERLYAESYNIEMQKALPRFAITGYDQAMFFLRGIHKYGKAFHGLATQQGTYTSIQTSYKFEKINGGGYQNREFLLIHFK